MLFYFPSLEKSFVKEHRRVLKNGKVVTIAAHYDKRVKKGTEHAPTHHHDTAHLSDEHRHLFGQMHAEQHLLHHYHGHALRAKVAEHEARIATLHAEASAHRDAGRHVEAAKVANKAIRENARRLRAKRELADIDKKIAGIGEMKGKLVAGSGAIEPSTDDSHEAYAKKLGRRINSDSVFPIQESERERQYRLNAGNTEIAIVSAAALRDAFEKDQNEKLVHKPLRYENISNLIDAGTPIDAYPSVGVLRGISIGDGRHRVAVAADRNMLIRVATHPDYVDALKQRLGSGFKSVVHDGEAPKDEQTQSEEAKEDKAAAESHPIVEHVTKKGKTLRGIIRTDLTKEQALAIDMYTFRSKNGGWFIREKNIPALLDFLSTKGDVNESDSRSLYEGQAKSDVQKLVRDEAALQQSESERVQKLRRERDTGLSGVEPELRGVSGVYGRTSVEELLDRKNRQQQELRARERALGNDNGARTEQEQQRISGIQGTKEDSGRVGGNNGADNSRDNLSDSAGMDSGANYRNQESRRRPDAGREDFDAERRNADSNAMGEQARREQGDIAGQNQKRVVGRSDSNNTNSEKGSAKDQGLAKHQADKLRATADRLLETAKEAQGRDRLSNTARRARMAAGAIEGALAAEATAKTMHKIADAIEAGEAGRLANVTSRAGVDELDNRLRMARIERHRREGLSYSESQKREGEPFGDEDIRHAALPEPNWDNASANKAELIAALAGKRGVKDLVNKLRSARAPTPELLAELKKHFSDEQLRHHGFGWWNVEAIGRLNRLVRMGIHTNEDLRATLADYVALRTGKGKEDPVTVAERALVGQKVGIDFFPTPKSLAKKMAELAGIKPGMSVLEPSAGNGHLADAAREAGGNVDVVELSSTLRNVLEAKGHNIVAHDFEDFEPGKLYDSVIMNPPFSDSRDSIHIMRAYEMLKPGGTLVAISGEGVHFRSDKKAAAFREWLDAAGAEVEKLPEGTFKGADLPAQTGANARLIVMRKPAAVSAEEAKEAAKQPDPEPQGPREGDTKDGADGTLVFRDGRWHRQEEKGEQKSEEISESPVGEKVEKHSGKIRLIPSVRHQNGKIEFIYDGSKAPSINDRHTKILQQVARSICSSLGIPRGGARVMRVEFGGSSNNQNLKAAQGYQDGETVVCHERYLKEAIKEDFNSKKSLTELVELMSHEFSHYHQESTGILSGAGAGHLKWHGKDRAENGKLYSRLPWNRRPWEREAVKMQGILAKRVIDDLVGQGLVDVSLAPENVVPQHSDIGRGDDVTEEAKPEPKAPQTDQSEPVRAKIAAEQKEERKPVALDDWNRKELAQWVLDGKPELGLHKLKADKWNTLSPAQQQAIEADADKMDKDRQKARAQAEKERAEEEAHFQSVAAKLKDGKELADEDITKLGLRVNTSDFSYLSPVVQRLFGISKMKVREAMGDALREVHYNDFGSKKWVGNTRKALANAAEWVKRQEGGLLDEKGKPAEPAAKAPQTDQRETVRAKLAAKIEEMGGKAKVAQAFALARKDPKYRAQGEVIIQTLSRVSGLSTDEVMAELGLKERAPRKAAESQPAADKPSTLDVGGTGDSDDPNSPNYRFRDTGYIAGSRKEAAAQQIREWARKGQRASAQQIDWEEIEKNPREAKELITKSNLFGKVNWDELKEAGMEPAAGYLVDRVYASVGTAPAEDGLLGRQDYARGIESVRARLEACKTSDDVLNTLKEMRDELHGEMLSGADSEEYQSAMAEYNRLMDEYKPIRKEKERLWQVAYNLRSRIEALQWEQRKRTDRKWKPDPEIDKQIAELTPQHDEANAAHEKFRDDHPGLKTKAHQIGGGREVHENDYEWDAHQAYRRADAIKRRVSAENTLSNPVTRAWLALGDRFRDVLSGKSEAFAGHRGKVRAGKVTDWSWAEKEGSAPRTTRREGQFQLQVADQIERVGGKPIKIDSTKSLKEQFGLRDVQSGNWVLNDKNSAEWHVQNAAEAFSDLADIIGADPKDIAMHGRLALAFGARGHGSSGWAGGAARAHYEPIQRVINITKMQGGGTLAHEWFHCVDNLISEAHGQAAGADTFITENPDARAKLPAEVRDAFSDLHQAMHSGSLRQRFTIEITDEDRQRAKIYLEHPHGLGAKIVNAGTLESAISEIDKTADAMRARSRTGKLKPKEKENLIQWRRMAAAYYTPNSDKAHFHTGHAMSSFELEARRLENGKTDYWSTSKEMAARAFQAYVEDKLAEKGRKSDYLSAKADNKYYIDPLFGQLNPFPEGEERKRINVAFDKLFAAMRQHGTLEKALRLISENQPMQTLFYFSNPADAALIKAHIHGHYRLNKKTGARVWVDSYDDKRSERKRADFAHWQHRIEHFNSHMAFGQRREALHAFHDLSHEDAHKLAQHLGLAGGEKHADKKTLMEAIHGKLGEHEKKLKDKVAAQVKKDFEKRAAAGMVGTHKRLKREWMKPADKKTSLIREAIDHLQADKHQKDIPAHEKKEDAELVTKLKDGVKGEPADKAPAPKQATVAEVSAKAQAATEKRQSRFKAMMQIKPGSDDLLSAIAKAGGLSRSEAKSQGIDPASFGRRGFGIHRVFTNGGMSFDQMAELLNSHGYPVVDEKGNYTPNALLDSLDDALRGSRVISHHGADAEGERLAERHADTWERDDEPGAGDSVNWTHLDDWQEEHPAEPDLQRATDVRNLGVKLLGKEAFEALQETIAMRHESSSNDEYLDALEEALIDAHNHGTSKKPAGSGEGERGGFHLKGESEQEIRDRENAKQQSEKAENLKAKADAERGDFVLSGSDRKVDELEARGQKNLFDEKAENRGDFESIKHAKDAVEKIKKEYGFNPSLKAGKFTVSLRAVNVPKGSKDVPGVEISWSQKSDEASGNFRGVKFSPAISDSVIVHSATELERRMRLFESDDKPMKKSFLYFRRTAA